MKKKVDPVVDKAIETLNIKDGPSRRRLLEGAGLFSATAAASALIAACTSSSSSSADPDGGDVAVEGGSATSRRPRRGRSGSSTTPTRTRSSPRRSMGSPTPRRCSACRRRSGPAPTANRGHGQRHRRGDRGEGGRHRHDRPHRRHVHHARGQRDECWDPGDHVQRRRPVHQRKPVYGTNRLCYVGQALYVSGQPMGARILAKPVAASRHPSPARAGNIQPRFDGAAAVLTAGYKDVVATGASTAAEAAQEGMAPRQQDARGLFAVDAGRRAAWPEPLQGLAGKYAAGSTPPRRRWPPSGRHCRLHHLSGPVPAGLPAGAVHVPVQPDRRAGAPAGHRHGPERGHPASVSITTNSRYQGSTGATTHLPRSGAISNPVATTST